MQYGVTSPKLTMLVWLATVVGLVVQGGALAAGAPGGSEGELRVMSFNIRYGTANDGANRWPNRRELVFGVLREHDCDVVGLQEALWVGAPGGLVEVDVVDDVAPEAGE